MAIYVTYLIRILSPWYIIQKDKDFGVDVDSVSE